MLKISVRQEDAGRVHTHSPGTVARV